MADDLRTPMGAFFVLIGIILLMAGFAGGSRAALAPGNVNAYCGGSMLLFGSVMLWLARRAH